jgi:hypothetical protein
MQPDSEFVNYNSTQFSYLRLIDLHRPHSSRKRVGDTERIFVPFLFPLSALSGARPRHCRQSSSPKIIGPSPIPVPWKKLTSLPTANVSGFAPLLFAIVRANSSPLRGAVQVFVSRMIEEEQSPKSRGGLSSGNSVARMKANRFQIMALATTKFLRLSVRLNHPSRQGKAIKDATANPRFLE